MSTTIAKPATTPIPVQWSENEFSAFILPHLSMPKRGPKCKLGYHRVFNLILWVLYTGMQWKCLPIPHDTQGKLAIHYTTIYNSIIKFFALDRLLPWVVAVSTDPARDSALPHPSSLGQSASYRNAIVRGLLRLV